MKKISLICLTVVVSIVISQKTKANVFITKGPDTAQVKSVLRQVNDTYGSAFAKGDSSLILACYSTDACIMPASSPALCGEGGILIFFKFAYKAGVRNIIFTTAGLFGLTDQFVTEQGAYEMFDGSNTSLGKGKYLVVWKKTANGWKMYRDMFNSDAPPARAKKP